MVADIPPHYTGSPSSLSATPHLTINKEAVEGLDSSGAFEGPEKLLEVWFSPSASGLPPSARPNGLKAVSQKTWREMLDLVNCQVLSVIESETMDAYLLSESSMFVFPHKLVLKTCGTTTLLLGLPRMLEIAVTEAGFPANPKYVGTAAAPHRVFYSRKNFLFPQQQKGPHRSWRDEVRFLDKLFKSGSAYMIGKMNGEHWYLYITAPENQLTPPMTPEEDATQDETVMERSDAIAAAAAASIDSANDETLEILMTDLDEENARKFYQDEATRIAEKDNSSRDHETRLNSRTHMSSIQEGKSTNGHAHDSDADFDVFAQTSSEHGGLATPTSTIGDKQLSMPEETGAGSEGHTLGTAVSVNCGLADLYPKAKYPDAKIDAYLFTPCGFSANGVVPVPGDPGSTHYFTVHVTPEPVCSYASFETNVPERQSGRETAALVAQVVDIFKPGRFSVTMFEAKSGEDGPAKVKKDRGMDGIKGYRRVDRVLHDLEGYELVFRHFEREGWQGGAPRLGEMTM